MKRKVNFYLIGAIIILFAGATTYLQLRNATTTVFLPTTLLNKDGIQNQKRTKLQISDFQLVLHTPDSYVFRFTEPVAQDNVSKIEQYNVYSITNPSNATIDSAQLLSSSILPTGEGRVHEFSVPRDISNQDNAFLVRGVTMSNEFIDSNTVLLLLKRSASALPTISQSVVSEFIVQNKMFQVGCSIASVKQNRVYIDSNNDYLIQGNELQEVLIGSDIEGDTSCLAS